MNLKTNLFEMYKKFIIWFSAKFLEWRVEFAKREKIEIDPDNPFHRFIQQPVTPWRCTLFGHHVIMDDIAGNTLFDVCARCSWVGKCRYDGCADEETKAKIVAQNKKDFGT